jgi:cell wall-associated NlpC family hydrolase
MTRRYRRRRHGRMSGKETAAAAVVAGLVLAAAAHSAGSGNVPASLTAARPPAAAASVAIAYARAQLGKPYVWGGTGPYGYDCSGLVMEAYASAGVSIPRTSQDQWAAGHRVSTPGPGDLVFFAGSDGTTSAPGHVGLVIGPDQMIEAYATGYPIRVSAFGDSAAAPGDEYPVGYTSPAGGQ